jgi:hypothetical protein
MTTIATCLTRMCSGSSGCPPSANRQSLLSRQMMICSLICSPLILWQGSNIMYCICNFSVILFIFKVFHAHISKNLQPCCMITAIYKLFSWWNLSLQCNYLTAFEKWDKISMFEILVQVTFSIKWSYLWLFRIRKKYFKEI